MQMQFIVLLALEKWCVLEPGGQAVQFRLSCYRKKQAGHPTEHDRGGDCRVAYYSVLVISFVASALSNIATVL